MKVMDSRHIDNRRAEITFTPPVER